MRIDTLRISERLFIRVFVLATFVMVVGNGCTTHSIVTETASELRASCFDVAADGKQLHLLHGVSIGQEKAVDLFYSRRLAPAGDWSKPVPIPTSHARPGNHHRGNDPQIAVRGNHVMALWTAQGKGPFGSGPIGVALSRDGGKTWRPGPTPSVPNTPAGYRFPALAAGRDAFHVVWIHAEGEERSLRSSRLVYGEKEWTAAVTIDPATCACCWNALEVDADGKLYALYRDEDPLDMALAVSDDDGRSWRREGCVGSFNWQFKGCPHVGGGLAVGRGSNGEKYVLASVWSGKETKLGAYALQSTDDGRSWSKPMKLRTPGELGRHTDIAVFPDARGAVVWDQQTEDEQSVYVARTTDFGASLSTPQRLCKGPKRSSYPRVIACGEHLFALWTEHDQEESPRLRIEEVRF